MFGRIEATCEGFANIDTLTVALSLNQANTITSKRSPDAFKDTDKNNLDTIRLSKRPRTPKPNSRCKEDEYCSRQVRAGWTQHPHGKDKNTKD